MGLMTRVRLRAAAAVVAAIIAMAACRVDTTVP
jgi:hypothetical protein